MSDNDPARSKRVPRFVEEYCKDRNGTRAALAAGWPESWAHVAACRLLKNANVQGAITIHLERISKEALFEAADVLREWVTIATADPTKIAKVRRVNCRHCWGIGHEYQWGAREYAKACDAAASLPAPRMPPDCDGGFGWAPNAEPNPACPECAGEGHEETFFADMDSLAPSERKLVASVKRTKDGLEVRMRDQDAAVQSIAKYLGMMIEKRELTGKNGTPLVGTVVPVELPADAVQLAALYTQIVGAG